MNKEEIKAAFEMLAKSQGFYGRILKQIEEYPEEGEKFLTELEKYKFEDVVDLVMYIES